MCDVVELEKELKSGSEILVAHYLALEKFDLFCSASTYYLIRLKHRNRRPLRKRIHK